MSRATSIRRSNGGPPIPPPAPAYREMNLADLVSSSDDVLTSQRSSRRGTQPKAIAVSGSLRLSFKKDDGGDASPNTYTRDSSLEPRTSDIRERTSHSNMTDAQLGGSGRSPFIAVKRNNLFGDGDGGDGNDDTSFARVVDRLQSNGFDDEEIPTLMEHDGAWSAPRPPAANRRHQHPPPPPPLLVTSTSPAEAGTPDDVPLASQTWGVIQHPAVTSSKLNSQNTTSGSKLHSNTNNSGKLAASPSLSAASVDERGVADSPPADDARALSSSRRGGGQSSAAHTPLSGQKGSSRLGGGGGRISSGGGGGDGGTGEGDFADDVAVERRGSRRGSTLASAASGLASMFRSARSAATEPATFVGGGGDGAGAAGGEDSASAPVALGTLSQDGVTRVKPKLKVNVPMQAEDAAATTASGRVRVSGWESNNMTPDRHAEVGGGGIEIEAQDELATSRDATAPRPVASSCTSAAYEWSAAVRDQVEGGTCSNDVFLRRGPRDDLVRCYVHRTKSFLGGNHTYQMYLADFDTLVLAARKRKKTKASVFLISRTVDDLHRESERCLAKLKANFMGSEYELWGRAGKDADHPTSKSFGLNLMGLYFKQSNAHVRGGPRVMRVALSSAASCSWQSRADEGGPESLGQCLELARKKEMAPSLEQEVSMHTSRQPFYNAQTKAYSLDFGGRVRESSVKNFQLVSWDHNSDEAGTTTLLQFGKVADDIFIVDFCHPFNLHTAFAIALASFDSKLVYTF